jgi:hypothetical protein
LYPETFGDRIYVRKKCVCPHNQPAKQKYTFAAIGKMPVTAVDAKTVKLTI